MPWKLEHAPQRIFVALDGIKTFEELARIMRTLGPSGVGFKVRYPLLLRFSTVKLESIGLCGPRLFADLKLDDIGSSVVEDFEEVTRRLQPGFVTCHASGSSNMLAALAAAAHKVPATRLVAVTVLTDFKDEDDDCHEVFGNNAGEQVLTLARRAVRHGISHIVCSPLEAVLLRERLPSLTLITPGIRNADGATGGQQRITTAMQAIRMGADYLVIGRPILQASDPIMAAHAFIGEVAAATPAAAA